MIQSVLRNEPEQFAHRKGAFLEGQAKGLLGGDVVRRKWWFNPFDPTGLPEMLDGSGPVSFR
jgi:hypothetical protein